jgi:hypothetical protein
VIPHSRDDPFSVYIDRESKSLVSVIKGCYVTPFMLALFRRNQHLTNGILMAIGPKEDKTLYKTFYAIRQDHLNINLNGYRAVSDQGTALRAVWINHENQQFLCLRHFLVSLKRKMWSHEAGTLMCCCVRDDCQRVCPEYAPRSAGALQDPVSLSAVRLGKTLTKIGLAVDGGAIVISNQAIDISDGAGPIQIIKYNQCPGVLPQARK